VRYSSLPKHLLKSKQSSTLPSELGTSCSSWHREDEMLQVLDQKKLLLFLLLSLFLHSVISDVGFWISSGWIAVADFGGQIPPEPVEIIPQKKHLPTSLPSDGILEFFYNFQLLFELLSCFFVVSFLHCNLCLGFWIGTGWIAVAVAFFILPIC